MRSEIFKKAFASESSPPADRVKRGHIDFYYLILVLFMLLFGTLMSYSASAVYGEEFYGDSFYFLKRYILFAVFSLAATAPFVLFATPDFWRGFGVALYAGSLALLILVLLIGTVGGGCTALAGDRPSDRKSVV